MKPPKFDYFAPDSVERALALIAEHGDHARFLAGGQSLVPMMNFRVATPSALIDLNGIADLRGIRIDDEHRLHIGAMTRTREIEMDAQIARANPLLHAAVPNIAHMQIRNRAPSAAAWPMPTPRRSFRRLFWSAARLSRLSGRADAVRSAPWTSSKEYSRPHCGTAS